MKKVRLFVSQNGWEYTGIVNIEYIDNYLVDNTEKRVNSLGKPTPDTITVDGVKIKFNEGFELKEL